MSFGWCHSDIRPLEAFELNYQLSRIYLPINIFLSFCHAIAFLKVSEKSPQLLITQYPQSWLTPNAGEHVTKETFPAVRKFSRSSIATLARNRRTSSARHMHVSCRCKQNKRKVFAGRFCHRARKKFTLRKIFLLCLRALPPRSVTKNMPEEAQQNEKTGKLVIYKNEETEWERAWGVAYRVSAILYIKQTTRTRFWIITWKFWLETSERRAWAGNRKWKIVANENKQARREHGNVAWRINAGLDWPWTWFVLRKKKTEFKLPRGDGRSNIGSRRVPERDGSGFDFAEV